MQASDSTDPKLNKINDSEYVLCSISIIFVFQSSFRIQW